MASYEGMFFFSFLHLNPILHLSAWVFKSLFCDLRFPSFPFINSLRFHSILLLSNPLSILSLCLSLYLPTPFFPISNLTPIPGRNPQRIHARLLPLHAQLPPRAIPHRIRRFDRLRRRRRASFVLYPRSGECMYINHRSERCAAQPVYPADDHPRRRV
jgi:hypothetical protein